MEQLLLEVGKLIQTKKIGEVFDLTTISGWNAKMDQQVNHFIADKQICGIVVEFPNSVPQKYRTTIKQNHVFHRMDINLKMEAQNVLARATQFKSIKGYSEDLSEYCREINDIITKIVNARSEFLDFNQKIITNLLKNTNIDLILMVGQTLFKYQLDGMQLVDDLIDLHSNCVDNLLSR